MAGAHQPPSPTVRSPTPRTHQPCGLLGRPTLTTQRGRGATRQGERRRPGHERKGVSSRKGKHRDSAQEKLAKKENDGS